MLAGLKVGTGRTPPCWKAGRCHPVWEGIAHYAGWDFTEGDGDGADWRMVREGEDYPRLGWQEVYRGDIAGLYGVDMEDLLEVAGNWLEEGCPAGCEGADIDGDGAVDLGDLAILAGEWLKE